MLVASQFEDTGEPGPRASGRGFDRGQEVERRRIARELHDDIGQGLALLAIEVGLLGRGRPAGPAEFDHRVRALSTRVRELSSAVHALAHQFHPVALERAGLVGAVRGLCREWSCRQEFDVEYVHSDLPEGTPPAAVLCLYRVAQEALRNAARHSGAGRVAVALGTVRGQVRLTVQDDGVGFDPAAARGLGLISMRERLDLVGGRLAVDAAPGRGTRIRATVPVGEPTPFRHEVGSR